MATLAQDNVITSAGLAPAPTTKLVPQTQDTTNYAGITGGVTESIISDYTNLNNRLNTGETQQTGTAQGILDVMGELTGKTAFSQSANESAGVNKETENLNRYAQQLADLNAQATSLNREAQAIPLQIQEQNRNTGATDRGVAPQEAGALRLNALRALSIGQQSDIAAAAATGSQLRLQAAKDKAQQMVDLKYKPLEEALAIKQKQYELNKDILASIDKKRTEALTVSLNKEAKDLEEAKAREKSIQDILTTAGIQQAPQDLLARAQKAKTPSEAAMILGQYAGDFYKTELLKQQILTEKAQKANYDANAQKTRVETGLLGQTQSTDNFIATLPKASQERYYKLQGDFDAATKAYRGAIDSANSITALSKDATAQDQTAIIFQYMKTLDPTSTVREGEFALVASTAGLGDRAVNALKKLDDGQRLNESQIKDIVGATKKLSENAKQNLDATSKEFDRRAAKFGLPTGLFYEPQQMSPEVTAEADEIRKKLELANPMLKKMQIPGTDILRLNQSGGFDFKLPTQQ